MRKRRQKEKLSLTDKFVIIGVIIEIIGFIRELF
ncbi:Uncharacterised protein [Streptococcus acidominimus]|uniref:Uncharacterized protein n=1 Tax=Streptococcus acidominimus TaxID=1326 RepID=A0A380IET6_STRAI|nr:Uncharacterised protein [Streptococcus acidominimus]